jgi:Glycosyltransferase family 87
MRRLATPGGVTAPHLQLGRAVAYGSLAVVTACGLAIAVLTSDPHSPVVQGGGRGIPEWIAGTFTDLAAGRLTLDDFYLLLGTMCIAYLLTIAVGVELRATWLLGAVVLLHVVFLLAPPLLSTDVFNYIDYARLGALHGLDPYIHGPVAAPHDPAFLHTAWRHTASAYGPLFTIASYPFAHASVATALWSFKAVAALSSIACVALIWLVARRRGQPPTPAVAVFGLNPLLLVWTVGGAHNDVLMLALMLGGAALVVFAREAAGGAALVAAAAVKATAGVALPFILIRARRRGRLVAGAGAAAVALYGLSAAAFPGHPLGVVSVLREQHFLVGRGSVPNQVALLFGLSGVTSGVRLAAALVLVGALAAVAFRVWRGADWIAGCGWAMVALVATSTWFLGWYSVWPLPFAALSRDRRLLAATFALQAFFVLNHVPGAAH